LRTAGQGIDRKLLCPGKVDHRFADKPGSAGYGQSYWLLDGHGYSITI
jgi:hypothetical protein